MPELDSVSLLGVCRGEREAWNAFVAAAGPLLRGVVWRTLSKAGRGADAPDVLQEVFVRLVRDDFRVLRQYDAKRAQLGTWLGVVATSTTLDWLRKCAPLHTPLDELGEHQLPVAPAAHEDERLELPSDLLSPRQALILKLLYEDDMDVGEVARQLHVEAQTVRSLRHKAISRLRAWLKDEFTKERG